MTTIAPDYGFSQSRSGNVTTFTVKHQPPPKRLWIYSTLLLPVMGIGLIGFVQGAFMLWMRKDPQMISVSPETITVSGKSYDRSQITSLIYSNDQFKRSVTITDLNEGNIAAYARGKWRLSFEYGKHTVTIAKNLDEGTLRRLAEQIDVAAGN